MKNCNLKWLLLSIILSVVGISQVWADTYHLAYEKNMPSENWDAGTKVAMTQSSANANRYYCTISMDASSTYGFFIIKNYTGVDKSGEYYKSNATAYDNEKVALTKYNGDYGGSSNRVTFTTNSAGTYIFTYDIDTKEIFVSPQANHTITMYYVNTNGGNTYDGYYCLPNSEAMTQSGSIHTVDLDLQNQKYYMYIYIQSGRTNTYWRGKSTLAVDNNQPLYHYNDGSCGGGEKVNFTPSAAGKYRFTWNHLDKTIKMERLWPVTYNDNDKTNSGTLPSEVCYLEGTTVTVVGNTGSIAKTGYTFGGWNTEDDGSGDNYSANETFPMPGSAQTLYAKWNASISLARNGGNADGTATTCYKSTSKLTISPAPTHATTGYTIRGYYAEAACTTKVASTDGTLEANVTGFTSGGKWTAEETKTLHTKWDNHYTVTLNDNGATVHGNTSVTATYGSAMPNISVPSKTGYIFGGYWTAEGGTGTKYYNENGTSATTWAIASNTELHAKWTGISYQVAFDANEGTGTMANQDFTYGADAIALTTNTYTRSGYYFLGWNTQPDGSGTKYHDGKSVQNLTTTADGIVTLYAQWAKTHTLYFLNLGVADWQNASGDQSSTVRYAYAFISYDDHVMYPLGTWTDNSAQGTRMTDASSISLPNVSGGTTSWSWSISDVPEGATVVFSDNTNTKKTSDLSGWTAEKPYYCKGNGTWYALDGTNTISKMTEMSVHLVVLTGSGPSYSESGSYDYGIDKHGDELYAIAELPAGRYKYKYYNWYGDKWSGYGSDNVYIMDMTNTNGYNSGEMNGDGAGQNVYFYTTVSLGEYKFKLEWVGVGGTTPKTTLYYPVDVSLALSVNEALAGAETTTRLTATPSASQAYFKTNPTYYYQMSTDNGTTWTTIAETSSATYDYTFNAIKSKFRVIMKNDAGLKSTSGTQDFTTYSTKSFYVYNPYNNSTNNWRWLHLYTWDSNNGNTLYNGTWDGTWGYIHCTDPVGTKCTNCENGNEILAKGGDWFYITINERANCFMLVGESPYNSHQTVTCYVSDYIQDGKYMIYTDNNQNKVVEYQTKSASDYRLKYTYGSAKERYSPIYNTILDGTEVTASMWMDASSGTSLAIQQGSTTGVWTDKVTYTNSSNGFAGLVDSDHRTKGYVFQMTLNFNTGTPTSSTVSDVAVYEGPYYVRTDALDGGWNVYKKADHVMTYTDVASAYDYYLCKWVGSAGTNVKFTIGNDYNPQLVESMEDDDVLGVDEQKLPQAANVRFAWNSSTNVLSRAYISGSSVVSDRFLVIEGDAQMHDANGNALNVTGLDANQQIFTDDLNWLYEVTVKAQPGARIKLTAKYNNQFQYFYGTAGDRTDATTILLLGGSGESWYKMRVVYDFKTNRLIKAFMPEGAINTELAIDADMMIIREHQGDADQITFAASGSLSSVQTVYGAMKFNKSTINDASKSRYERDLFWISFPFDVKLSDAFGFGEYGKHWIIEYYDGIGRATNGFWADSPSNWKFVMPADRKNFTMKAFEGYILALDLDEMTESSAVWDNGVEDVYVYFPSDEAVGSISAISRTVEFTDQSNYLCIINRATPDGDRRIKDSYWHCIGVPSYAEKSYNLSTEYSSGTPVVTDADWTTTDMPFLYEWNSNNNSLTPKTTSSFTFKPTYSYLVQYSGDQMVWSDVNATPASVAARLTETPDREFQLALIREDEEQDHTFVRLTDETAVSNRFEFNYDLSKEYNAGRGNIWTVTADTVEVAGNSMPKPLQTTLVPVGVKVVANGEYTLAMPEGTNGENVVLIDNAYGTRTNLGLMPYTVTLTAGTYDSRFALEFAPIQDSPTSLENDGLSRSDELNDANDDVRKVLVGGRLYIIRDGKVYDAAGQRVE